MLNHYLSDDYIVKIALLHYSIFKSTKSKRSLCELYDLNLTYFSGQWARSYDLQELKRRVRP